MSSPGKYRARTFCIDREAKGYLFVAEGKSYIVLDDCKLMGVGLCGDVCITDFVEVRPESVEQSTGLKDKNGVDLDWYAGDIIQKGEIIRAITVDWEHGMRFMLGKHILCKQDGINGIKIGNIHTTPKLLEGK